MEDEVRISHLLRIYLERESYVVEVVHNGDDRLTKVIQEDYDLIILDVFMPGKDRFTVLEELRKYKNTLFLCYPLRMGRMTKSEGFI